MLQKVIGPSQVIDSPQLGEGTTFLSQVTLGNFSSEAATTTVETTVSQLDGGYIAKNSLEETTIQSTIVHSITVGSSWYQEQGALGSKLSTTTSGGNSDDPINLGDGLRY
ncbi:hypothetical protein Hanom_Chr00s000005g01611211 [Helianthus anomalus]